MRKSVLMLTMRVVLVVGCGRESLHDLASSADRVVIHTRDISGRPKDRIVVTDTETIRAITGPLGSCKPPTREPGLCGPPLVEVRIFERNRLVLSVAPSDCCSQFYVDGILYEDSRHRLRAAVRRIIEANSSESECGAALRRASGLLTHRSRRTAEPTAVRCSHES